MYHMVLRDIFRCGYVDIQKSFSFRLNTIGVLLSFTVSYLDIEILSDEGLGTHVMVCAAFGVC